MGHRSTIRRNGVIDPTDDDRGRWLHSELLRSRPCEFRALYVGSGIWVEFTDYVVNDDVWDSKYMREAGPERFHWEDECPIRRRHA